MQTILMIDDDQELVRYVAEFPKKHHFTVVVAHDGAEGATTTRRPQTFL